MKDCPICGRKMFSTSFDINGEVHCPIHGEFNRLEFTISDEYKKFKKKSNAIIDLVGSIRFLKEKKNTQLLNEYGYENSNEIISERMEPLSKVIFISQIINTKFNVDEFLKNIGYNKKQISNKIRMRNSILIYEDSISYFSLEVIDEIFRYLYCRDCKEKEMKMDVISDLKNNINNFNFNKYFMQEIINFQNPKEDIIFFSYNKNNDYLMKNSKINEIRKINRISRVAYYEYIIKKCNSFILDIELNNN